MHMHMCVKCACVCDVCGSMWCNTLSAPWQSVLRATECGTTHSCTAQTFIGEEVVTME